MKLPFVQRKLLITTPILFANFFLKSCQIFGDFSEHLLHNLRHEHFLRTFWVFPLETLNYGTNIFCELFGFFPSEKT